MHSLTFALLRPHCCSSTSVCVIFPRSLFLSLSFSVNSVDHETVPGVVAWSLVPVKLLVLLSSGDECVDDISSALQDFAGQLCVLILFLLTFQAQAEDRKKLFLTFQAEAEDRKK